MKKKRGPIIRALLFAAALFILPLSCNDPDQGLFVPWSGRTYIKTMGGDVFDEVRAVAETSDGGLFCSHHLILDQIRVLKSGLITLLRINKQPQAASAAAMAFCSRVARASPS